MDYRKELLYQNRVLFSWTSVCVFKQVKKKPVAAASAAAQTPAQTPAPGPVSEDKSGAVTVSVHVKPGSKQSGITGGCQDARSSAWQDFSIKLQQTSLCCSDRRLYRGCGSLHCSSTYRRRSKHRTHPVPGRSSGPQEEPDISQQGSWNPQM